MSTCKRGGISLIEVLIAMFLFGLFTTIVGQTVVTCYRNYVQFVSYSDAYRQTQMGMSRLSDELRQCVQVYTPDPTTAFTPGVTITPTPTTPFVFAYMSYQTDSLQLVSYQYNALTTSLLRTEYAPASMSAYSSSKTICSNVSSFKVTRMIRDDAHGLLCIQVEAQVPARNGPATIFFQSPTWSVAQGQ